MSILSVRLKCNSLHKNNANKRAARITFLLFENTICAIRFRLFNNKNLTLCHSKQKQNRLKKPHKNESMHAS